jgi:hypothetical protein
MSTDDRPFNYRIVWEDKPVLHASIVTTVRRSARAAGRDRRSRLAAAPAISRIFTPAVVSTDILPAPWLKALAGAQRLPFAAASFDNIAMFDVLHHLDRPRMFL